MTYKDVSRFVGIPEGDFRQEVKDEGLGLSIWFEGWLAEESGEDVMNDVYELDPYWNEHD